MLKFLKKIFVEILSIVIFLISYCPGYTGNLFRRSFYKMRLKKLGKNLTTEIGLTVTCPQNISVGNNSKFMRYCSINACDQSKIEIGDNISVNFNVNINSTKGGYIKIGDNVLIASNVVIRAADHILNNKDLLIKDSGHAAGQIVIGNNVWIGSNCVILKDVNIGDGAVIGAGTVVTRDVGVNEVVIGNKQTKVKNRF